MHRSLGRQPSVDVCIKNRFTILAIMKRKTTKQNTAAKSMDLLRKEKIARNIAEIEELARTMSLEDYVRLREEAFAHLEKA